MQIALKINSAIRLQSSRIIELVVMLKSLQEKKLKSVIIQMLQKRLNVFLVLLSRIQDIAVVNMDISSTITVFQLMGIPVLLFL